MIQVSEGNVHLSPDDFQATDGAITYGVKFRYIAALANTAALILEKVDGDWYCPQIIDEDVETGIAKAGGPAVYAETVIRPAVKAWLAARKLQPVTPAQEVAGIVGKWVSL